ncbi:hypothetical protein AB3S75_003223 [Citrus x aurantiifolia]
MSEGGDFNRRTANYHPNIWGDRFINYNAEDEIYHGAQSQEIEELKEEVRRELLGSDNDLYHVALRFRILRQRGYKVSCDIFNKFKDGKGNFKESLKTDVSGMLSLYEAAHLGVHGEDILDEAIAFTTAHLQSPMAPQVIHALRQPLYKGLPRIEARFFISLYQEHEPLHNKALLKLAKLDFNQVQSLYKIELSEISRWWKDLDFARKLPFARDRVVETFSKWFPQSHHG